MSEKDVEFDSAVYPHKVRRGVKTPVCPGCDEPISLHEWKPIRVREYWKDGKPGHLHCPAASVSLPPIQLEAREAAPRERWVRRHSPRDSFEGQHPTQTIDGAARPGPASPADPGTESTSSVPESPSLTPQVHSTLLEMIGFAAEGRCMACGWPLKASADEGCVQGNCSFRPGQHTHEYSRWWQRTQILTLARKYFRGELKAPL